MDPNDPCLACRIVSGEHRPVGGIVARAPGLIAHANAGGSPIAGWIVLTSTVHVRGPADLEEDAAASLGPMVRRVAAAQRSALGAELSYAITLNEVLRHFHLHVFPRYADTPARFRGRGAFDAAPADMLADGVIEEALDRLRSAVQ